MGQYYHIILKRKGEKTVHAYDRTIDGEYTMAKLMEHSWYLNPMVNAICEKLYHKPSHIAWVGDYYNETEEEKELWKLAYGTKGNKRKYEMLHGTEFTLNGRYIVNHTKKLILDCWQYLADSIRQNPDEQYYSWVVHPLPLLVALGNGRGGGDYRGKDNINVDEVGTWAWDVLEIVEYEDLEQLEKSGYQKYSVLFFDQKKGTQTGGRKTSFSFASASFEPSPWPCKCNPAAPDAVTVLGHKQNKNKCFLKKF